MKSYARLLVLLVASCAFAHGQNSGSIAGDWTGTAVSHGQQVPVRLELTQDQQTLRGALLNGPDRFPAASATFSAGHLLLAFPDYARTLDATLSADGTLSGDFGTVKVRYPIHLAATKTAERNEASANGSDVNGDWEIEVKSQKGESAWLLRLEASAYGEKGVIQKIDGDTGSLYGRWNGEELRLSHFTAAGPALYSVKKAENGTLRVSNLLRADQATDRQQDLVALRPEAARAAKLPEPTDSTAQTRMKDPSARLAFRAPDLKGHVVASNDPRFDGKVVIVAVGGSWCPNCHDEAPFLEGLYKQFHSSGLEIVNLSFEDDEEQLKNPERLRAFVAKYHLDYPVLLAGTTDQLNEKIPQAENLNCWPTSFLLGRDGRVRQIHAGFAGPANAAAHAELVKEVTAAVEELLAEPVPSQSASTR